MTQRTEDLNGWYEIAENPISKVGVFPYTGASIDPDGELGLDPEKLYGVLRPEDELANPVCAESFRLVPWVDDHTFLGKGGSPAEKKGVQGVVGEQVFFDEKDKTLKGNLKVFSEYLKSLIERGKEELSLGYRCTYEPKRGNFGGEVYDFIQRNIRGNHLALVEEGRMGKEVCVQDHFTFTFDSKEFSMNDEEENKDNKASDGEMSLAEITSTLKTIMPQVSELMKLVGSMNNPPASDEGVVEDSDDEEKAEDVGEEKAEDESKDDTKAALDSLTSEVESLKENGEKTFLANIAKRDKLVAGLTSHIGTFDHSEMTLSEVARYGVEKLSIACDSGHEVSALNGFLKDRTTTKENIVAIDSAPKSSDLSNYLSGGMA